ncbi:MAG: hypothetical protein ACOYOK_11710 [Pseudobdellovibrionaceae bacterium]
MNKIKIMTIVSLSLLVLSCSSDDGKKIEDKNPEQGSCAFAYNEGEGIDFTKLQKQQITTTAFSKKFNQAWQKAVLHSSAEKTAEFMLKTNLDLYKTPATGTKSCLMLSALQPVIENDKPLWSKYTQDDGEKSGGYVMGLYLPKEERKANKSLILVREDGNRWTLVHEFMHHLFYLQLDSDKSNTEKLKLAFTEHINQLQEQYDSAKAEPENADFEKLSKKLYKVTLLADDLMKQYFLEEMAIESNLRQLYDAGEFKYVPTSSYNNGKSYISSSASKAIDTYKSILAYKSVIELLAETTDKAQNLSALEDIKNLVDARLTEIENLKQKNTKTIQNTATENNGQGQSGLHSDFKTPHTEGCSHSREIENIFTQLKPFSH